MSSANNRYASAAARGRAPGLSTTYLVRANIVKREPSVDVASPPPTSVSLVNQKIDSSATANTTDVKSASTSSSKASCYHNDNSSNCTSDGARVMGVMEKEPSQQQSSSAGVSVEKPQMDSLEGRSMGRHRFTPQQDQKSHQGNYADFGSGSYKRYPGGRHGSYRKNRSHWDVQQNQQMHPTMINPRNNHTSPPAAPLADHSMSSTIAKQIEYYFSPASLWKNISLRRHMNEQGWVPVSVIARFHQVERLMEGIPDRDEFILNAVKTSTTVETEGDKIRRRGDWIRWILPQLVGASKDGNSTNPERNNHLQSSNGEGTSEGNEMKDCLREFSTDFTCQLPIKMEVHDQLMAVDDMKELLGDLRSNYELIKIKFDDAAKSSSEGLFELINKHPSVVDMPLFQDLFSDEIKTRFELLDTTIAENKGKMPNEEPDEQHIKVLQQELSKKLLAYEDMIGFVESSIRSVEEKDIV